MRWRLEHLRWFEEQGKLGIAEGRKEFGAEEAHG
jgi:hypothetical protein